jgi:hypothetical protein
MRKKMSKWNPDIVVEAAKKAGLQYEVYSDWKQINPYGVSKGWTGTQSEPVAIMWHHTAGGSKSTSDHPSLNYCRRPGAYAGKARACNMLLDRKGKLHFIGAYAQYHAGTGGPLTVAGKTIPKNSGNSYIYGVEIEASDSHKVVPYKFSDMRNITDLQFEAMSKFSAALCDLMGWDTKVNIRHQDWTNGGFDGNPVLPTRGRKVDVRLDLNMIRAEVEKYRVKELPVEAPVVSLTNVKNNVFKDVRVVQVALRKEVGGRFLLERGVWGKKTTEAYRKWQQKMGAKTQSGKPHLNSLRKLGERQGFKVTL